MPDVELHPCTQAGCNVQIDGKCLEGLPLDECPHYEAFLVVAGVEASSVFEYGVAEDEPARPHVSFHLGDYLDAVSASQITRASLTRVVFLLGEPDSGKTTLLASLNDAFQKGPFAEYRFARSLTLPGFERVCHQARIKSGNARPDTERTKPVEDVRFLHLGVRGLGETGPIQDLLLADVSGERLQLAKNSVAEARKLDLLARADHVALLFDGRKLADPEKRHRAKQDSLVLLRSCLDAGVLGSQTYLDVLFSKWDVVEADPAAAEIKAFAAATEAEVRTRYGPRLGRLRFFNLAARPAPESDLAQAFNLDHIFTSWVRDSSLLVPAPEYRTTAVPEEREFARYRSGDT